MGARASWLVREVNTRLVGQRLEQKVVVLVVWEVQEVRLRTLPGKGGVVLGEIHGMKPVVRTGVCHRRLGP